MFMSNDDMASMCGRTVTLSHIWDDKAYFHQNNRHISKCRLELRYPFNSHIDPFDQIAFHFTELRDVGLACITIGQFFFYSLTEGISGLESSYCNGTFPELNTVYTTTASRTLFVTFVSEGNASFEFVFNKFKTKHYTKCKDSYQCDNNRCVPNGVNCNGHNPCGDNSDCQIRQTKKEDDYNSDGKVDIPQQFFIVGSVIVCLMAVMTFVVRHRRKQQQAIIIELSERRLNAYPSVPRARPNPHQDTSPRAHQRYLAHDSGSPDVSTQAVSDLPPSYKMS